MEQKTEHLRVVTEDLSLDVSLEVSGKGFNRAMAVRMALQMVNHHRRRTAAHFFSSQPEMDVSEVMSTKDIAKLIGGVIGVWVSEDKSYSIIMKKKENK